MTEDQLVRLNIDPSWLAPLLSVFDKYEINTTLRQASFIGQCCYESSNFTGLEENLNYSAESLTRVWPTHFNASTALDCARQPEKIGNIAYANRMGNGDISSGDGWKYRGRGLIQITGKDIYRILSAALGQDFIANPDLIKTPEFACLSAGWFWNSHSLNTFSDAKEYTLMTKAINGGVNGIETRIQLINRALSIL